MITFRDRGARGRLKGSTLDAFYSFSFGDYRDPKNMGFRALRVLNEDFVIPGAGFSEHGHADMEIVTIVLDGAIAHRDDLGNEALIRAGDVQRMSAGTGIRHSEMNPSLDERAHALQLWIVPAEAGAAPSYEQKHFPMTAGRNAWLLVASPEGRDGSLTLRQDARLELARLDEGMDLSHDLSSERGYWVQVIGGIIGLNGTELREGDGAALTGETALTIEAETQAEVLLIDLP
ncbi:pirin family protein [Novosphingobium sp. PS1R-30]|uniref:Pirin family protein n=1 Tax=Novosphingobium anseongense TaxID=3133436 RepID=A0ABU8S0S1_9SPHN